MPIIADVAFFFKSKLTVVFPHADLWCRLTISDVLQMLSERTITAHFVTPCTGLTMCVQPLSAEVHQKFFAFPSALVTCFSVRHTASICVFPSGAPSCCGCSAILSYFHLPAAHISFLFLWVLTQCIPFNDLPPASLPFPPPCHRGLSL